jgi:hypothetical protein
MLNRRAFLKTGAAALPLAATLDPAFAVTPGQATTVSTPALTPLPPRLAPENLTGLSWRQRVRRVVAITVA